jgi:GAF domain-containing protein
LRLVESLAVYTGIAVNNAMQYAEIEQNALLREGLLEAGHAITALKEPQEVLQAIAESVREALACDVVTLYAYDQAKEEIGFPAAVSGKLHSPQRLLEQSNVRRESVIGQLVALGHPYFADDSVCDPMMAAGSFVQREGIRSSAGIPLRVGDETLGILFANYRSVHHFALQDHAEIELFATQAAIAIYNARLYRDLERQNAAIRRQSQHGAALYEASKAITAGFSVDRRRVLDSIVEQAVERITGVDAPKATWGKIQLYDETTHELVFESVYSSRLPGFRGPLGQRQPLDRDKAPGGRMGITSRVVRDRIPQRVSDVQQDPDYVEFDPATRAELDVPLFDGDKVIGILGVESDEVGAFDDDDEQALKGLAELAVIAIKNAERAEQLSRTNAVAVMGAWGADVVHDVNREVGAIRRITFALQQQPDLPAQVKDGLQKVDTYAASLALPELPEEPLQISRILEFRDAPLLDLVVGAEVEHLQTTHSSVSIKLEPNAAGIQVAMHELWLRRLLRHLVNNAVQAISDKMMRVVTVRTLVQGMVAEVQVEDTGKGVQPEIEAMLFGREVPHQDRRPGRGLVLVDFLARQHGGRVRLLWNRPGEGACFAFTIPVAQGAGR